MGTVWALWGHCVGTVWALYGAIVYSIIDVACVNNISESGLYFSYGDDPKSVSMDGSSNRECDYPAPL